MITTINEFKQYLNVSEGTKMKYRGKKIKRVWPTITNSEDKVKILLRGDTRSKTVLKSDIHNWDDNELKRYENKINESSWDSKWDASTTTINDEEIQMYFIAVYDTPSYISLSAVINYDRNLALMGIVPIGWTDDSSYDFDFDNFETIELASASQEDGKQNVRSMSDGDVHDIFIDEINTKLQPSYTIKEIIALSDGNYMFVDNIATIKYQLGIEDESNYDDLEVE